MNDSDTIVATIASRYRVERDLIINEIADFRL